jgi:hypothetical protein
VFSNGCVKSGYYKVSSFGVTYVANLRMQWTSVPRRPTRQLAFESASGLSILGFAAYKAQQQIAGDIAEKLRSKLSTSEKQQVTKQGASARNDYFPVFTYAIAGTEGADGGGGGGVNVEATDTASTPPRIDVTNSDAIGRRDTMLATRWMANVTLHPIKPLGDRFTTTCSQTNSNHTR